MRDFMVYNPIVNSFGATILTLIALPEPRTTSKGALLPENTISRYLIMDAKMPLSKKASVMHALYTKYAMSNMTINTTIR
jgi:hypothetical protein